MRGLLHPGLQHSLHASTSTPASASFLRHTFLSCVGMWLLVPNSARSSLSSFCMKPALGHATGRTDLCDNGNGRRVGMVQAVAVVRASRNVHRWRRADRVASLGGRRQGMSACRRPASSMQPQALRPPDGSLSGLHKG